MKAGYNFSSVHGKIRYLLMEFDNTHVEQPMKRMVALLRTMPGVKFLLWCSRPDIHEMVCQHLRNNGINHSADMFDVSEIAENEDVIVVYEYFSGVNPWIRDAFFPANRHQNECLLLDTVDEDASDQGWAKRLCKMKLASGLRFKIAGPSDDQSNNLGIAGGDVLIDDKWVFLGHRARVLEDLIQQEMPGQELVVLHEKEAYPELYHIDLFMTLTGQEEEGQYVVLMGQCVALQPEFKAEAMRLNVCLDAMATRLEKQYNLKVLRNPIPLDYHFYAYNNCLLEVSPGKRRVWLPAYTFDLPQHKKLRELELENEQIWQSLGFSTTLVNAGFSDLLGIRAGLHCITNEVREN